MRFRMSLCSAAMALLILPGVASAAGPDARDATLDGASEVPAVATAATGDGWVVISSDNTTVTYFVEYSGLSGALAAAHIHTGAPGVAGGVILPLAAGPSPMFGTLTSADFKPSGSVTTFAEALAAIRGGTTYFNLHTAANPGGEIRGNLTGTAEALEATIDGAQEVPAVATAATGNGLAVISSDGTSVGYAVTYGGLSGALAAAHIHTGAPGVAGGVILPLAAGPSPMFGTLTSADFKPSGSVTTFAEALAAIRGGTTYFNLHTAANPGGEIRGQIGAAAAPTPTGTQPATSTESPIDPNGAGSALPALTSLFIVAAVGVLAGGRRLSSRRTR
ncbi:MAG: CHRD domain-containing protein [Chloroflexi bacterium CSP1-4]|nr:MAG: CHRD domain-containing protein [Chloroflexi bacterium CSP1-4]